MLGEFTGKHQSHSCLDFSARESCLLVIGSQLSGFGGDSFKYIIDEGVHDGHALLGDTGIGMDLFEDLVDVRGIGFDAFLLAFSAGADLLGWGSLLGSALFGGCLGHRGIVMYL